MNETKLNIVDQLLNSASPKNPGAAGVSHRDNDLHYGYDKSADQFDKHFDTALNQQSESVDGFRMKHHLIKLNGGLNLFGLDGVAVSDDAQIMNSGNSMNVDTLVNQEDVISALKMSITNEHIKSLMNRTQVELPNGTYNLESVTVSDKKVTFEINPIQSSTSEIVEPVKINVPLDALKIDKEILAQLQNKVELNQAISKADGQQIQELFDKLNLKQIEIKGLDSDINKSQLKAVSIVLISEDKGNKVALNNSLMRNQVTVSTDTRDISLQTSTNIGAAQNSKAEIQDADENSGEAKPNLTVINGKEKTSEFTSGKVNIEGKKNNISDKIQIENQIFKADPNINAETKFNDSQSSETAKPVRMQLPESIKTVLRPNGQAITIKIDPENLGPARLSLKLADNKLTAHLTVHSIHAKNLLEHSIERLIDQLHKVDIHVEKIDITLDDRQQEQNAFARQTAWQRKFSYKNLRNDEDYNIEQNQMIIPQMLTDNMYVTSTGVNLLA